MKLGAITNSSTHPDHLAPLCYYLQIPLVVTDRDLYELTKHHYPQIETIYCDHLSFNANFLKSHFEAIILSGKKWTTELAHITQGALRFIYCPHGNSDKTFGFENFDAHLLHDIHLVYGPQMLRYLSKYGILPKLQAAIPVGNYRYHFYKQFQSHFDDMVQREIFNQFKKDQPTIFYAPTWVDNEASSSFIDSGLAILNNVPAHFNLIVKLHPLLEKYHPSHAYYFIEKCKSYPNVVPILNYPPIYPILNRCSVYLGDYSSVGYDVLAFKKPMLFLHKSDRATPLDACGSVFSNDSFKELDTLSQSKLNAQETLYADAFDQSITPESLKPTILSALESTKGLVIS